jgi:hypothetical protein
MATYTDLLMLRDKLWSQVSGLPGVVTIGIGSKNDQTAFVVFVDENKVHKDDLPAEYADFPVILEPAGQAKAHGG